jgi:hypothetical protein
MNKRIHFFFASMVLTCITTPALAGDPLEEYFYASGKIRVVLAVVGLVMIGLLTFVITLDRRLKRLEKKK